MEEKRDFFVRAGQIEDEDDLMDELNQLEADLAEEELEGLDIGTGPIANANEGVRQPAGKVQNKVQNEEDELKALEMMMS